MENYYVYIIQSSVDGSFYKGFTTDYLKRLQAHNEGKSTYTAHKIPWKLVYLEKFDSKTEALKKELMLKRQNANYLNWLIQQPNNLIK